MEEGHCLRDQALSFCSQQNTKVNFDFYATSLETLRGMVMANVGVSLFPKLACYPLKKIVYLPFKEQHLYRKINLYWRQSSAKKILFEKIANCILAEKTLSLMTARKK